MKINKTKVEIFIVHLQSVLDWRMSIVISLEDVRVEFEQDNKKVVAVDGVDLKIEKGDIFGIVGFSGAGKSTLVRTINLLQRPTSGKVIVGGQNILDLNGKELRKKREKIGMIFQHFNLMNSRTVLENVTYPLKNSSLSKVQRKKKAQDLLNLVDIGDKADSYPSQLSGGQKQRVAIARALANDPDILLCDEATSALDPQTTGQILKLLKKVNKDLGITIVLITHEMQVVKSICNRVAVMELGRVVEEGNIFDIFARPNSQVTKNFIQTVNHTDEFLTEVEKLPVTENLGPTKRLVKLVYIGQVSQEPVVAELLKNYSVVSNIIWGNIEVIGGQPIGNLGLILEGEKTNLDKAIVHLADRGAIVDEINLREVKYELL